MDSAEQVEIEYSPLDGVGNVLEASRVGAPVLHDALGTNIAGTVERDFGEMSSAFSGDATVVQLMVRLGRVIGGSMEPRGAAASMDAATGQPTVWTPTPWGDGGRDRLSAPRGLERTQGR